MQKKNVFMTIAAIVIVVLVIVACSVMFVRNFDEQINSEREKQLKAVTSQTSDTFENAIEANLAYVNTAASLFSEKEYSSAEEISTEIGYISERLDVGGESCTLVFLDADGYCYDKDEKRGIWGDFDRLMGDKENRVFISDSATYSGINWAFVKKLDTPVEAGGGKPITYAAILKDSDSFSKYYDSDAYGSSCETYILQENGTRMYDSLTADDTIQSYNVYKYLRTCDRGTESVLAQLETDGISGGRFTAEGGGEYCYCLARLDNTGFVLMFLVPSADVATDTVTMISSMTWALILIGTFILFLICAMIMISMKLRESDRLYDEKQRSLQESIKMSERLAGMNYSLLKANQSAETALDIARSANKAKSNFLSNMSHDIRTPLNAIIGFLQLLDKNVEDVEKVRLYSGKISASSRQLLSLINDILDMSRIESGKTSLNVTQFPLGELLNEVVTIISAQAGAKHQHFTVEYDEVKNISVITDKLKLSQILINLLSNAVKYTGEGGDVLFRARLMDSDSQHSAKVRFLVKDNGIGMSEEFQRRIFEPFEREQTSTIGDVQGTGLGMTITKNLVDLMGGIITVNSKRGSGSAFTVELSFVTSTDGAEITDTTETHAEVQNDILKGKNILVAEDNSINAEIISELLYEEGAHCDIAVNGKEALEKFAASEDDQYDAIFMDIQMPVMNGYDAAKAIRACGHPNAVSIPIATMTANAFAEDVQKALESGMNAHIPKPVDMRAIKEFMAHPYSEK